MVSAILSRLVILVFGTLYPAYASYKAVRTKNVKEYVKWMMYWIVFALFTSFETVSDVFLSWMPFYYEVKILFVLWMLSPMTNGSSFLFKKFVHPHLARREKDIDEMIAQARNQSYTALLRLGSRGITYASQVVVKTALMGQSKLVDHLRRSYSTSDLSNDGGQLVPRHRPIGDEDEDELDNRWKEDNEELENRTRQGVHMKRSSSTSSGGLHILKEEEEEEEEEVTITETFTIPVTTRHFYSPKEHGETLGLSTRSSSEPIGSGEFEAPLASSHHYRSGSWSSPARDSNAGDGGTGQLSKRSRSGSLAHSSSSSSGNSSWLSASASALLAHYRSTSGSLGGRTGSYGSTSSLASSLSTPPSSLSASSLPLYHSAGYASSDLTHRRRWGSWSSPGSRLHSSSKR
ncbi:receptor expression-enhancing protein 4-like isoform X2 [Pomacea canaliculata]|uniref:receptor expression-enhancing protein 4-like isoform X2 n=1 Tax=Pomacea canaliculata TaxID=400727 RepID=UPI000D7369AF|nr:receptor expression-enhancing protein 4-like isoform X2 [Pomacea canaliculata]